MIEHLHIKQKTHEHSLLPNYDFIYYSVYIILNIKLTVSGLLLIFHPTEFLLIKFYLVEINAKVDVSFICDYQ